MTKEILFIIGPVLAALLTWALQKVYSLVVEKIAISKDIATARLAAINAEGAANRVEEKMSILSKTIEDTNESIKKLDNRVSIRETRGSVTEGAVKVLVVDYKRRKK